MSTDGPAARGGSRRGQAEQLPGTCPKGLRVHNAPIEVLQGGAPKVAVAEGTPVSRQASIPAIYTRLSCTQAPFEAARMKARRGGIPEGSSPAPRLPPLPPPIRPLAGAKPPGKAPPAPAAAAASSPQVGGVGLDVGLVVGLEAGLAVGLQPGTHRNILALPMEKLLGAVKTGTWGAQLHHRPRPHTGVPQCTPGPG